MEHDLPGSFIRSCHLTRLRSNFQVDLLVSKCIPMFRCVSKREIQWFSLFYLSQLKGYLQKVHLTKKQHNCLTFPGKVKMRPKVVKSGWLDSKHPKLSVHPCCETLSQLRGKWAGGGGTPTPRCGLGWRNSRCGREFNSDVRWSPVCHLTGVVSVYQQYHLTSQSKIRIEYITNNAWAYVNHSRRLK